MMMLRKDSVIKKSFFDLNSMVIYLKRQREKEFFINKIDKTQIIMELLK
jgi:hypothetical protein